MFRIVTVASTMIALAGPLGAQRSRPDFSFSTPGQEAPGRVSTDAVITIPQHFDRFDAAATLLAVYAARQELPGAVVPQASGRRRATKEGAIIGGVAGFAAGAVFGYVIGKNVACEPVDGGDCSPFAVAAVSGLIVGAGGAVAGALIGSQITVARIRLY